MEPKRSRELIEGALPLVVLLVLFFLAFSTLEPFLPALLWGVTLAVALQPLHHRLLRLTGGRRGLATTLLTTLLVVVLILPMLALSQAFLAFIPDILEWGSRQAGGESPPFALPEPGQNITEIWRTVRADLDFLRLHFEEELRPVAFWLINEGRMIGTFVVEFAIGVALTAFILHRSNAIGEAFVKMAERVAGPVARHLSLGAVVTIRSTVLGVLGSAMVQTVLASVSYWFVGAPHWPVLALVTFLLAMIQIGPVLVWVPLAIWLWADGQVLMAIVLTAWSIFVVGLSDNVVKIALLSRGTELPSLLAFLGALGGLLTWGIVGLFLGPVVIAVCYRITTIWLNEGTGKAEEEV